MYNQVAVREAVERTFSAGVAAEDAKRWHPVGYVHGRTIDPSALVATLHWVSWEERWGQTKDRLYVSHVP